MLDELLRIVSDVFGRNGNAIMSRSKGHTAGSDNWIRQMSQMVAYMLVEIEIYIGRERAGRGVNRVGDARSRRHDGIVGATLLLLMNLIEAMGDLMRATAQEGA